MAPESASIPSPSRKTPHSSSDLAPTPSHDPVPATRSPAAHASPTNIQAQLPAPSTPQSSAFSFFAHSFFPATTSLPRSASEISPNPAFSKHIKSPTCSPFLTAFLRIQCTVTFPHPPNLMASEEFSNVEPYHWPQHRSRHHYSFPRLDRFPRARRSSSRRALRSHS